MTTKKWDGNGLPPVGVECEFENPDSGIWEECTIVAHYKDMAVCVDRVVISHCLYSVAFRLIKTEREKKIEGALTVLAKSEPSLDRNIQEHYCQILYDAGLLK